MFWSTAQCLNNRSEINWNAYDSNYAWHKNMLSCDVTSNVANSYWNLCTGANFCDVIIIWRYAQHNTTWNITLLAAWILNKCELAWTRISKFQHTGDRKQTDWSKVQDMLKLKRQQSGKSDFRLALCPLSVIDQHVFTILLLIQKANVWLKQNISCRHLISF